MSDDHHIAEARGNPRKPDAFDLLAQGNVSGAVAAITSTMDTRAALDGLAQLCRRSYRDLKSISTMTALAWEAVAFALRCAAGSPDAESASHCKLRAKGIAYNAGANCWPGWAEPIVIDNSDILEGLKLAERSYELVEELSLGQKEVGAGLWLVGALQMAAGRFPVAISRFLRAEEAFRAAHLPAQAVMAQGYTALIAKAQPECFLDGAEALRVVLLTLRAMESKESQFFADQLVIADRVFSFRGAP